MFAVVQRCGDLGQGLDVPAPAGAPFSHSALDIKSYAMALLQQPYRHISKRTMPPEWHDPLPHTHVALDDAKAQGTFLEWGAEGILEITRSGGKFPGSPQRYPLLQYLASRPGPAALSI